MQVLNIYAEQVGGLSFVVGFEGRVGHVGSQKELAATNR